MRTRFRLWLSNIRRFFSRPKTIRKAPCNRLGGGGSLEQRVTPAIFGGGVTVASADVDGDGAFDIIAGAGRGGAPLVKVYSGKTGAEIREFLAFETNFSGGVFVAAGDVNGDGKADIVVGAGDGGTPRVRVFDGGSGNVLFDFLAYDRGFGGGVRVAVGDVTGDGKDDIITGAGPGGGPHVEVFDGVTGQLVLSAYAFDAAFSGGVYVGAGDITGDGRADIIAGAGEGGMPIVNVLDPVTGLQVVRSFVAYDPHFTGGVRVAAGDITGDGRDDIITGAGPGGGPHVEVFDGTSLKLAKSIYAYDPSFTGGVFVSKMDFGDDNSEDILTGPGAGGGPNVRGFDGNTLEWRLSFYAFENDDSPFTSPGAFADHSAPTITITSPNGNPTQKTNLTITGQAKDNGSISSIQVNVDREPAENVSFDANGNFSFITNFVLGGFDDGQHTISFVAMDHAGNQSAPATVTFTLDSSVALPRFNLNDLSDTGTKGDYITSLPTVNLDGHTDPNAQVKLVQTNSTTTADTNGDYHFLAVPLNLGQNTITIQATDQLGNTNELTTTVILNSAPTVSNAMPDVTVKAGAADQVINLSNFFSDVDVVQSVVRFDTIAGPVDVELLDQQTPLTVANFLNYVRRADYDNSIFHRLVHDFVLQGGAFQFHTAPSRLDPITTDAPIPNEPGISNTRGTIAMAKLAGDPNSATSQFYFNLIDNSSNLDVQNGGFTVFGHVVNGLSVIDQLATFPITDHGGVFNELPMQNYSGTNFPTDTRFSNYAAIKDVFVSRHSDRLAFTVTTNDNPAVVSTSFVGDKLTLHFAGGTGTANITVQARDLEGNTVSQTFQVSVNP
ncbi:MAG: peptidylprolyl isomerase [Gemmataceae bacterium]